jgi:Zn-dependent peptidase ImmA (M78 family)/formiminotetrahydrofolate cyclodeaminase
MTKTILHEPAIEMLHEFGAGKPQPGSGSAAAFEGMLAAKLLMTVITVTQKPRYQPRYDAALPLFAQYYKEIDEQIFPELKDLFLKDSEEFGKAMQLRVARRNETDGITKNYLRCQEMEQMKVVVEIPMQIAKHAIKLCEMANIVFDQGFEDARGDSHAAFSGAVAALAGSLAIIRLNLLEFGTDDYRYCETVIDKLRDLDVTYTNYNALASSKIAVLQREYDVKLPFYIELHDLVDNLRSLKSPSREEIETGISELRILIWKHRNLIWPVNPPNDPKDLLDPKLIFTHVLGYDYVSRDEFGVYDELGNTKEIAGLIHQTNKLVVISNRFSEPVQRFTAAHELAHALFHKNATQFRDLPEHYAKNVNSKSRVEREADWGATCILMPKKFVEQEFIKRFGAAPFVIDENTTFNLTQGSISALRGEVRNLEGMAAKIARAESYGHVRFDSLAKFFNVSVTAMAIRLEQLELVRF